MNDFLKASKDVIVDPRNLYPAVNPRSLEELDWEILFPKVQEEDGVITDKLLIWKLDPEDALWVTLGFLDPLTGAPCPPPPMEKRAKARIPLRGHRRSRCCLEIVLNPNKYSKVMCENAARIRAVELYGIAEERARKLALDAEAQKDLKSWETVKLVLERYTRDEKYGDIALEMPSLLYRALLTKGADKYDLVASIHDGAERNKKIKADLRNKLDTWFRSCHLMGPAMATQLILYFRYKENKRPDKGDKKLLRLNLKYETVRDFIKKTYVAERDSNFTPVHRIELVSEAEETSATRSTAAADGGWFIVEGGNPVIREMILKLMYKFQNPEAGDDEIRAPKKSEQAEVRSGSRSKLGKSYANYFTGNPQECEESRSQLDTWALAHEEREERLKAIRSELHPLMQTVVDVVLNERNLDKVEAAFRNVGDHIFQADKRAEVADEELVKVNTDLTNVKAELQAVKSRRPTKK